MVSSNKTTPNYKGLIKKKKPEGFSCFLFIIDRFNPFHLHAVYGTVESSVF